jgi:acyl-CoA thioesterase-1
MGTSGGSSGSERDLRLDFFRGIDRLRASGAEVVLMDPRFSRQTHAVINFDRYESILREVTDANEVPLFRRHDIMRHWAESGLFDLMTADHDNLPLIASRLYDRIGRAVADFISRGAHAGAGAPAASTERDK